jgi:hypothetical protein
MVCLYLSYIKRFFIFFIYYYYKKERKKEKRKKQTVHCSFLLLKSINMKK